MAIHGSNGKEYRESDIEDGHKFLVMKSCTLTNDAGDTVVPVRREGSPHFRVLGGAFSERRYPDDVDETHTECIRYLMEKLNVEGDGIKFSTFVFDGRDAVISPHSGRPAGQGAPSSWNEQVIFSPSDGAGYRWFFEVGTRFRFHDQCYIQPDIAGVPSSSLRPTSKDPGVIIEVVRTHLPSKNTFKRLYELSLSAHMVMFYLIPEGCNESQYNRVWKTKGHWSIRFSFYLISGKLFENGMHIPWLGSTQGERYVQCVDQVLKNALVRVRAP